MAGMGNPKPPGVRQRRNRTSTFAMLSKPEPGQVTVPKLPTLDNAQWHRMTLRWWLDIWASPMAPEFDESDIHAMFALAFLVNDFWLAERSKDRRELLAEIRLQSQRFGLSPMDRRRLQWQTAETESKQRANRRGAAREVDSSAQPPQSSAGDPRNVLRSA